MDNPFGQKEETGLKSPLVSSVDEAKKRIEELKNKAKKEDIEPEIKESKTEKPKERKPIDRKQGIIDQFGGISNIPPNHPFWRM